MSDLIFNKGEGIDLSPLELDLDLEGIVLKAVENELKRVWAVQGPWMFFDHDDPDRITVALPIDEGNPMEIHGSLMGLVDYAISTAEGFPGPAAIHPDCREEIAALAAKLREAADRCDAALKREGAPPASKGAPTGSIPG